MNSFERIIKWNKDRNGLRWDASLEVRLITEEIAELQEALVEGDPAHILQEAADVGFVIFGTQAKYRNKICPSIAALMLKQREWENIGQLIDDAEELLAEIPEDLKEYAGRALEIVVSCNEAKGTTKDSSGKVVKGEDYVPPLERINEMLKEEGYYA